MSFNRGFLNRRIVIWNPQRMDSLYGGATIAYFAERSIWANVKYVKGIRAMHQGQTDVYQTLMIRCDFTYDLTDRSRLEYDGKYYAIDSFNADRTTNEIQMTVFQIEDINKNIPS